VCNCTTRPYFSVRMHLENEDEQMSRRRFSKPLHDVTDEFAYTHDSMPDFASVALYIPAIQVVGSTILVCVTVLLSGWLLPHNAVSSIRSLSLCLAVAAATVRRPARIGNARGMDSIFNTIRPAVLIYITALVIEQLAHSCVTQGLSMAVFRMWLFQCCMVVMMAAGFVRAWYPRHENDAPFVISLIALAIAALMPPSPADVGGPLCAASTGMQAIERIFRALLFSSAYCTLAFAAHPHCSALSEVTISSIRAAAGSIWVLGITPYCLPLVPVQIALILFSRLMRKDNKGYSGANTEYNGDIDVDQASLPSDIHSHPSSPQSHDRTPPYTFHPQLMYNHSINTNSRTFEHNPYDHDLNEHKTLSPYTRSPTSSVASGCIPSLVTAPGGVASSANSGFSFGGLNAAVLQPVVAQTPQQFAPNACTTPMIVTSGGNGLRCISGGDTSSVSSVSSVSKTRTVSAEQLKAAAEALDNV